MQTSLFTKSNSWQSIKANDAKIAIKHGFIRQDSSIELLNKLMNGVPWRHDKIKLFGKEHNLPRLQQWYGDYGKSYVWSGIKMDPIQWPDYLLDLKLKIEKATKREFNSALINLYRCGNDTVSWHSDDEEGLGDFPFIASLSLGAERDFCLRRKDDKNNKLNIKLTNGSLLVMGGGSQKFWEHSLPVRKKVKLPRVNLTFRNFK